MASWLQKSLPRVGRLRAFDAVATAGTMSAAANRLRLTQPAITRAVQMLEGEVGVRLLARSVGGSFLTAEGRGFARRTQRFLQHLDAALAATLDDDPRSRAAEQAARQISNVHIRSLLAIWEARSFRRAARALGVAEPTLHRPARDLEHLVKVPLFRRIGEGWSLSPSGAELARRFALACVEIEVGIEEIGAARGAAAATMTLGVLPLAPKPLLAQATQALLDTRAHARTVIQEGDYDKLVIALRTGTIDAIFGALRHPPPFADLVEESLFDDPYGIVCRRGHPLMALKHPNAAALKAYDWVFPTANLPRRAVLDQVIAAWKLSPRVRIETNSLGALVADLVVSDRISLLPRAAIHSHDRANHLAILDIRVPHTRRTVGLTMRSDWLPTEFQDDFLKLLREAVSIRA
ncbi:MAG TPA: LysR family transcriptional regulator [Stellaceae bacterium]|nr:LysR family transcriptional regulator [Stellaceae bacterium]